MLAIQLNPQLHRAVHILKKGDSYEVESTSMAKLSLSKEESSALDKTFSHTAITREKELTVTNGNWT